MQTIKIIGAMLALSLFSLPVFAANCGSIFIAEMNWASAEFMANVDKIILKQGYGCNAKLELAPPQTSFASMTEKGQPDVAPEFWTNFLQEPLKKAMDEGKLYSVNPGPITDLGEGWWISPKTAREHPELKTVLDVIEHPELFPDKEDPSKGAFVSCPAGWGCQLANANLFRAFKMKEKGWKLIDPGSGAGLDGSIANAVVSGKNWFGYYWSPTALIGKYKLIKLPYGVPFAGNDNWDNCISRPEDDCADPKPSSWSKSEVISVITSNMKKNADKAVIDYFKNRVFPGDVMNNMLVYMSDNQASGEDAAIEFLQTQQSVWQKWVPGDVAKKIKKSLK